MDYKEFAEALGLKMEASHIQGVDECSVEGPTEKVLTFRDETSTYGVGWHDLDDKTSIYFFIK